MGGTINEAGEIGRVHIIEGFVIANNGILAQRQCGIIERFPTGAL